MKSGLCSSTILLKDCPGFLWFVTMKTHFCMIPYLFLKSSSPLGSLVERTSLFQLASFIMTPSLYRRGNKLVMQFIPSHKGLLKPDILTPYSLLFSREHPASLLYSCFNWQRMALKNYVPCPGSKGKCISFSKSDFHYLGIKVQ